MGCCAMGGGGGGGGGRGEGGIKITNNMLQRYRPFTAQWQVHVTHVVALKKNSEFFP